MPHTEYMDLTIPLDIRITPSQTRNHEGQWHSTAAVEADPIIARNLVEARRDGWELDGSTSFVLLASQGKVRYNAKYGLLTSEWKYTDYISVTIRMRRVAP